MTLLKIPYGISNFRAMREEGYVYVDKTGYIRVLEDYPAPYQFFLIPRRFGKSLFVSVLNYYYDIREKDTFQALFNGNRRRSFFRFFRPYQGCPSAIHYPI